MIFYITEWQARITDLAGGFLFLEQLNLSVTLIFQTHELKHAMLKCWYDWQKGISVLFQESSQVNPLLQWIPMNNSQTLWFEHQTEFFYATWDKIIVLGCANGLTICTYVCRFTWHLANYYFLNYINACMYIWMNYSFSVRRKSNEELLMGYLRAGNIILMKNFFFFSSELKP